MNSSQKGAGMTVVIWVVVVLVVVVGVLYYMSSKKAATELEDVDAMLGAEAVTAVEGV